MKKIAIAFGLAISLTVGMLPASAAILKLPTQKSTSSQSQDIQATQEEQSTATAPESAKKLASGLNYLSSVEERVIDKINQERKSLGLGELIYDEDLQIAARIRSRELYKSNTFRHKRPNGDSWATVLTEDVPYTFLIAGENLCSTEYNDPNCKNATSPSFWFNQWKNSESHYENMIRPQYNRVGVGIYCIEKGGMTYAYGTTLFAGVSE